MIFRMIRIAAGVALAAALAAPAHATTCSNGAKDWPTCTPPGKPSKPGKPAKTTTISPTAKADSTSSSKAGAAAGAVAGAAATGTNALDNSIDVSAPAAASVADQSHVDSSAWSLFLPPPAWVPPMAPVDCASAMITQDSELVAWNAYSRAAAKTDTSDCTLIRLRNAKVESCQYGEAKQIEDLVVAKYLKDYQPGPVKMPNYSHDECKVLKAPPPPPTPITYALPLPPVAPASAPPAAAKPAPKKVAAKKPVASPAPAACADGAVPQCKAPEKRT
mgnify:CR=1 FL=1